MGITHFRSDVKEQGTRKLAFTNASIVTATVNTLRVDGTARLVGNITADGNLSQTGTVTGTGGVIAGSGKYFKLGSIYIITGTALTTFTGAGVDAVATAAAGVALATSVPRGSLFINASSNVTASGYEVLLVKAAPATWCIVSTASAI